jgi:hypothetical protein
MRSDLVSLAVDARDRVGKSFLGQPSTKRGAHAMVFEELEQSPGVRDDAQLLPVPIPHVHPVIVCAKPFFEIDAQSAVPSRGPLLRLIIR